MIPLKLTFKGIYSYKNEFTIDFTRLMSAHLFGIFGSVGSGKSSILEAMTFAVYKRTDRLGKQDKVLYNMMNLQSNEMFIDFECWAGKNFSEKYRFVFKAKRNPKKIDDVKQEDYKVYIEEDGIWIPKENADSDLIVGMDYESFKKTIIIPQGTFQDFINQTQTERTKMLESLFNLEQYDLSPKVKSLLEKANDTNNVLSGRLLELGDSSVDKIDEIIKEIEFIENNLKSLEEERNKLQDEYNEYNNLKETVNLLKTANIKLENHLLKQNETEQKRIFIKKFEKASVFKEKIQNLHEIQNELNQKNAKLSKFQVESKDLSLKKEKSQKELNETTILFNNISNLEKKKQDLSIIINIDLKTEEINDQTTDLNNKKSEFDKKSKEKEKLLFEKNEINSKTASLKPINQNIEELNEISQWFTVLNQFKSKIIDIESKISKNNIELKKLLMTKESELTKINAENEQNYLTFIEENEKHLKESIESFKMKQKLSNFVKSIEDGKPCPLCGSLNHPEILHIENVDEELLQNTNKLKLFENVKLSLIKIESDIKNTNNNLNNLNTELKKVKDDKNSHENSYSYDENLKDEERVTNLKTSFYENQKSIEAENKKLQKVEKSLQDSIKIIENLQKGINETEKNIYPLQAEINSLKTQLSESFDENIDVEQQKRKLNELNKNIEEIKSKYKIQSENLTKLTDDLRKSEIQTEQLTSDIKELINKISLKEIELNNSLTEYSYSSIEEIEIILNQNIQIEKEKEIIEKFEQNLNKLKAEVENLKSKLEYKNYNEQIHNEIKENFEKIKKDIESKQLTYYSNKSKINELKTKAEKKELIEKEKKDIEVRITNLTTFKKLFTGKGFVKYVSEIYLKHLVHTANLRFLKLTKNHLGLEVDDSYEFVVKDYLNGGKIRLLKTLSGGQVFQAAFCLALALSENVKNLNSADQSFFFIDEGFGSLDKESLKMIFETLKLLKYEDRIVGVISHVESLQNEIDVYLSVKNTRDEGSIITPSWEY